MTRVVVTQGYMSATRFHAGWMEPDLGAAAVRQSAAAVLDATWLVSRSARPVVKTCAARV